MKLEPKTRDGFLFIGKLGTAFLLLAYVFFLFMNPLTFYLALLFGSFRIDIGIFLGNWFVPVPIALSVLLVREFKRDKMKDRMGAEEVRLKYMFFIPLIIWSLLISLGQVSN